MAFQTVFQRYEMKYAVTAAQQGAIIQAMAPYMKPDSYGHSIIRNIYFDTDNYRLIRHSIEKAPYKEKLRVRSYAKVSGGGTVFVELKKKYDSIVYKRRLALPEQEAMRWLDGGGCPCLHNQIADEIEYFRQYYGTLQPRVFLTYERDAFYGADDENFRVTFDQNALARTNQLSLRCDPGGTSLMAPGTALMEVKVSGAMPLWMTHILKDNELYRTSFSKYGTAYREMIQNKGKGEMQNVG